MSAVLAQAQALSPTWRRSLWVLSALLVALLLLLRDTLVAMVGIWSSSETFAHAFLVPPIAAWLAWRDRDRLQAIEPRPAPVWLVPMALAGLAWLVGELATVNAVSQAALVAMVVLSVPLVLGNQAGRALLFPLLFLFFCVPVGEFLLPVLMERTADFTVAALRLTGVPVYREGLNFVIPTGNWSVVEACSGVRYLIASLMVGAVFAYLNYQSLSRRLVFVGVAIAVPIVANWVRAYLIVMLGHLSNNQIATGVDHLVYGWVFFGIVITIMFMIGSRWAEPDRARVAPLDASQRGRAISPALMATVFIGGLLVPGAAQLAHGQLQPNAAVAVELAWPAAMAGGWQRIDDNPWQPRFVGAASTRKATFRQGAKEVNVFIAYYRGQHRGQKLVSSLNALRQADDPTWNAESMPERTVAAAGAMVPWRATRLSNGSRNGAPWSAMTIWQTYWLPGRFTNSDVTAKLWQLSDVLAGRGDDGAAIVLSTPALADGAGDAVLHDFVATQLPAMLQALQQAHARR